MRRTAGRAIAGGAATLLAVAALAGCASDPATQGAGDLTVSAAASLTEAFTQIADDFEAENPGTTVRLNFGGSSSLAEQVAAGAPVDVLATASLATMAGVVADGHAEESTTFARNSVTIAVPPGNPAGITSLADLSREGVRVAECAPEVPCGAAAATTLQNAGVDLTPVTLDPDVKTVLGRVASGEVDAGLVYATDVKTADVTDVTIPGDVAATTDYAIAVIRDSGQPDRARAFVQYVMGEAGQQVLAEYGFGTP